MSTAPRRLGKYELQQQVGRGNVGEVWQARDVSSHRDVAIKIIHSDLQSDPHFLARFTSQGPAIASLRQANIVQVHETNVSRNTQSGNVTAYIAMDYIQGQTLAHFIDATAHRGHIPSVPDILYLFTKIGPALDYAHQHGLFHGDIKPDNILLNRQQTTKFAAGEPMLTDIGTAQIFGTVNNIGLPFYISPEQAAGYSINDRSDIYSLGVILYEICTGVTPFRGESATALMLQHMNTLPTPPILINPSIPPALSEVILRAMAKNPGTRFPHASQIATAIAEACSMESSLHVVRETITEESAQKRPLAPPILGVSQPLPAVRLKSLSLPGLKSLPSSTPLPPVAEVAQQTVVQDQKVTMPTIPSTPVVPDTNRQPLPVPTTRPMPSNPYPPTIVPVPQPNPAAYSGSAFPGAPAASIAQPPLNQAPPVSQPLLHNSQPKFPVSRSKSWRNFNNMPVYMVAGILLLLLIIVGSSIAASIFLNKRSVVSNNVVGHIFFQDDALGHNDQLRIEIQSITNPEDGKNYVFWLRDNQHKDHLLGVLPIKNGGIYFTYAGDNEHTNLLSATEGFIITAENSASVPTSPTGTPIYQAMFNTATLPYLRNILYSTPGLPGKQEVVSSIFETIKSMNDKATSVVDSLQADVGLSRRQATRIVEMIDGSSYATSSGDRPAGIASQLTISIGLLSSPNQPGYIDILDKQLDNLNAAATNNQVMLQHIQNVKNALADLRLWLQTVLIDNVKILKAGNLKDPAIQSIALEQKQASTDSYTGRIVPPNAGPEPVAGSAGALQAYSESQYLATLDLQAP